MTIDEFIKALESKAELEKERAFNDAVKWNCITEYGEYCRKHESEYRQLAEWLKELKELKQPKKDQMAGNKMTFDELLKDAQNKGMPITELCKMLYDENVYLNQCVTIEHEAADYWAKEHDKLINRIKDLEQKLRQWRKYDI